MKKSTIEGTIYMIIVMLLAIILPLGRTISFAEGIPAGVVIGIALLGSIQCLFKNENTWSWQRKRNKRTIL